MPKKKPADIWWVTTFSKYAMLTHRRRGERLVRKTIGDNARELARERKLSTVITTTLVDGWMVAASMDVEKPIREEWPSAIKDSE